MRIKAPAFFAVAVLLVSGCGQKGALFLPEAEDSAEAVMLPAIAADEEEAGEPESAKDQEP